MRYYTLAVVGTQEVEKKEYPTEADRNTAAREIFADLVRKWDVVQVLSVNVDEKGELIIDSVAADYSA